MKRWIVRSDDQMRKVCGQLLGLDLGHPLEVKVEEYKPRRTEPQNRKLWVWHKEVAADLTARMGLNWTPEDVHYAIFCKRFLPGEVVRLPNGEKVWKGETSSTQTKEKISQALDEYYMWALEAFEPPIYLTNLED